MTAPVPGYTLTIVPGTGNLPQPIWLHVCDRCGSWAMRLDQHDAWHGVSDDA